jgi:hypothetical protein
MALVSVCIVSLNTHCHAQTWNEWFNQKKTQQKYLVEQIVALQVYIGYVRKSYEIAQKGLSLISHIKNGDLNLHRDFFGSLKAINPAIKNYEKIAGILNLQARILDVYQHTNNRVKTSDSFSMEEIGYIDRVYGRLLHDCSQTVDVLITVTTAGNLEMRDDERLQQIDILYEHMRDNHAFCQRFGNEAMMLAASRLNEENEMRTGRALYGL